MQLECGVVEIYYSGKGYGILSTENLGQLLFFMTNVKIFVQGRDEIWPEHRTSNLQGERTPVVGEKIIFFRKTTPRGEKACPWAFLDECSNSVKLRFPTFEKKALQ